MARSANPTTNPSAEETSAEEISTAATRLSQAMADTPPLVQNITNWVAMDLSANVLLAIGASPAMVAAQAEAAEFAQLASSLVINIGTFEESWLPAAEAAAAAAKQASVPWVLDPVAVGVTAFRSDNACRLCGYAPAAIRGNASEILALARVLGLDTSDSSHAHGVDAGDSVAKAQPAARALAHHLEAVVCVTGEQDFLCDTTGASLVVSGGAPLTARVTATGCALSAVVAAFLASGRRAGISDLMATGLAAALFSYSAEQAARALPATASGSFRVGFVDALGLAVSPQGQADFAAFAANKISAP